MQLITGGMGFVGRHTAKALLDLGETCVLTSSQPPRGPQFITEEIGKRIFVEPLDAADLTGVLEMGKRHRITGIIHLGSAVSLAGFPLNAAAFFNILHAAREWGVSRVSYASTIGVYAGVEARGPLAEDLPLPMEAFHPIPTFKKVMELIGSQFAASGVSAVGFRFAAWGPLHHHPPSPMNIAVQMVRAAIRGASVDFSLPRSRAFAEDGADASYVKDCGRAIALLQLARKLNHHIYNIGSGRATRNREYAAAIRKIIPDARLDLPQGFDPKGPGRVFELEVSRLRADTGFAPEFDVQRGVADYISWLRAGNVD